MILFKQFTFDSAHYLPNVPRGHKCEDMHGHTYKLTVFVEGDIKVHEGWVMDFGEINAVVKNILEHVDHKMLNSVRGLENPTCENIGNWLYKEIKLKIPMLSKIELYETPTAGVIVG
jgi:6-pyruvoyltetrahydropterin/6-carboxytetrahydropterin synthase